MNAFTQPATDRVRLRRGVNGANYAPRSIMDVCVTVTMLDGLIVGTSPFHNSLNYRGVVVRGTARPGRGRLAALRLISDHLVATATVGRGTNSAVISTRGGRGPEPGGGGGWRWCWSALTGPSRARCGTPRCVSDTALGNLVLIRLRLWRTDPRRC